MISCAIYSTIMKYVTPRFFNYRPLKQSEWKNMLLVSVVFIVNIVLSNSSLKYNSLALDQVRTPSSCSHSQMFRCAMPVFTCVLEFIIHGTVRSLPIYLSLIPVIIGTMLVCAGDVRLPRRD